MVLTAGLRLGACVMSVRSRVTDRNSDTLPGFRYEAGSSVAPGKSRSRAAGMSFARVRPETDRRTLAENRPKLAPPGTPPEPSRTRNPLPTRPPAPADDPRVSEVVGSLALRRSGRAKLSTIFVRVCEQPVVRRSRHRGSAEQPPPLPRAASRRSPTPPPRRRSRHPCTREPLPPTRRHQPRVAASGAAAA